MYHRCLCKIHYCCMQVYKLASVADGEKPLLAQDPKCNISQVINCFRHVPSSSLSCSISFTWGGRGGGAWEWGYITSFQDNCSYWKFSGDCSLAYLLAFMLILTSPVQSVLQWWLSQDAPSLQVSVLAVHPLYGLPWWITGPGCGKAVRRYQQHGLEYHWCLYHREPWTPVSEVWVISGIYTLHNVHVYMYDGLGGTWIINPLPDEFFFCGGHF